MYTAKFEKNKDIVEEEIFPFFPFRLFGWSSNLIDIGQINKRKPNLVLHVYELKKI